LKPHIVSFSHGRPLTALERMCLASQVKAGHRVTVFSYAPLQGLPSNVENEDAEATLPLATARLLRHFRQPPNSNWHLLQTADLFRIRLQRLGRGLWLDNDVYLLRALEIDPTRPYCAWESRKYIGNAVLYLPKSHPIVEGYEKVYDSYDLMPDWLTMKLRARRAWWNFRRVIYAPPDLSVMMYGPLALTALAKRHGCEAMAMNKKSFYAHGREFFYPCDVAGIVNDPKVFGIHVKRKLHEVDPPRSGSFHEWARRNVEGLY